MTADEEKDEIQNLLGTAAVQTLRLFLDGRPPPAHITRGLADRLEKNSVQLGGPAPGASRVVSLKG